MNLGPRISREILKEEVAATIAARNSTEVKENYKYIEDVPNNALLYKKYLLDKDWDALKEKYGGLKRKDVAEAYVWDINNRYFKGAAKVSDSSFGVDGWNVVIFKPETEEFKSILGTDGKLLPTHLNSGTNEKRNVA